MKKKSIKKRGRPKGQGLTPNVLQKRIENYFISGVTTKLNGKETIKLPTMTGLAIYCGFNSKKEFTDLGKEERFEKIILKAKSLIEQNLEERLQLSSPVGSIFALKAQHGWSDQSNGDYQNQLIHFLMAFNKFLLKQNGDLAFQVSEAQQMFMELVMKSTSIEHLDVLIDEKKLLEGGKDE